MLTKPLAEKMRPKTLEEVVGQQHLIDEGKVLQKILEHKQPTNLILWGPPGCGKTTLARIIAKELEAEFVELSAVTSGKKDVERVIEHAKQNWNLQLRTVLFVDEIHRFNKAQQDAFLPHVESGLITLIGATTENPSFEIINPLLSRSRVIVLQPLENEDILKILKRAIKTQYPDREIDDEAIDFISSISSGDARSALGNLETALSITKDKLTAELAMEAAQKKMPSYDKNGSDHYDTASAFIKSMRASDQDATGYYLARMIQAGEDPKFIARRMIIFASEDIGLAGNGALSLAVSAFDAIDKVGMPEASYILFHTALALAKSKKSRETTNQQYLMLDLAKRFPDAPIPLHIRNSTSSLTRDLGYAKDYKWESGFKHSKGNLPEVVQDELSKRKNQG